MSRQTVAKPDNMKLYFMSHSRKNVHILQKLVEKGIFVTEKAIAMTTAQIRSLTDLGTVLHHCIFTLYLMQM